MVSHGSFRASYVVRTGEYLSNAFLRLSDPRLEINLLFQH